MRLALAHLPVARLARTPGTWLVVAAWAALALVVALDARLRGAVHGADRALLGAYAPFVLPLLCWTIVGRALSGDSLTSSGSSLVAFGASPRRVAVSTVLVAIAACLIASSIVGALVAMTGHGASDPPALRDALSTAYASALGGTAYASLFALGASFGRRGGGRTAMLLVDGLLGGGTSVLSVALPRAHLRNLLGGAAPLAITGRASAVWLVALTVGFAVVAVWRASVAGSK
jgi:hypothetical protein